MSWTDHYLKACSIWLYLTRPQGLLRKPVFNSSCIYQRIMTQCFKGFDDKKQKKRFERSSNQSLWLIKKLRPFFVVQCGQSHQPLRHSLVPPTDQWITKKTQTNCAVSHWTFFPQPPFRGAQCFSEHLKRVRVKFKDCEMTSGLTFEVLGYLYVVLWDYRGLQC